MKLLITALFITIIFLPNTYSQKREMWGVVPTVALGTAARQYDNSGTIFKMDEDGNNFEKVFTFPKTVGVSTGQMTLASNGMFYGSDYDYIYEYNPNNQHFNVLHAFDVDSTQIYGVPDRLSLILASNGMIYGVTYGGGAYGDGTMFKYDLLNKTYSKITDFNSATIGGEPRGRLLEASNGRIYGTYRIGVDRFAGGGVFELDPVTDSISKLNTTTVGFGYPDEKLIEGSNGKLYGIAINTSRIFEVDIQNKLITNSVFEFGDSLLNTPRNLYHASNGKLYMTARSPGPNNTYLHSILVEFDYLSSSFRKIQKIDSNGFTFITELKFFEDTIGNIYINRNIDNNKGADLIQYNPLTDSLKVVRQTHLDSLSAKYEVVHVLKDSIMYGSGKDSNYEYIFEYNVNSQKHVITHRFNASLSGKNPKTALFQASNGKFYGTTSEGGLWNYGVFYEFDPITNTQEVLIQFSDTLFFGFDESLLAEFNPGILTATGSAFGLFTYNIYNKTYSFKPQPIANAHDLILTGTLLEATNGLWYGIGKRIDTMPSAAYDVIYEYNPNLDSVTSTAIIGTLNENKSPQRDLIEAADGLIYGLTRRGGNFNEGTIFSYNPSSKLLLKRYEFNTKDGFSPNGPLCLIGDSLILGISYTINQFDEGGIYKFNILTNNFTILKVLPDSNLTNISIPYGGIVKGSNGKLFGISGGQSFQTQYWGVYEYKLDSNQLIEKFAVPEALFFPGKATRFNLTIADICYPTKDSIGVTECEQYTVPSGRQTIKTAGTYILQDTINNTCGGDSLLTINLTLKKGGNTVETIAVCDEYTWQNGITYFANNDSAQFIFVGGSVNGCDSTVNLNLSILTGGDTSLALTDSSIIANEKNATYQWLNCSAAYIAIANETGVEFTPTDTGYFAVEITKNNCVDTSACILYKPTSITKNSIFSEVKLYPNPANNKLFVDLGTLQNSTLSMYTLQGKLVLQKQALQHGINTLPLNFSKGIYLVEIENNQSRKQFKIVKL